MPTSTFFNLPDEKRQRITQLSLAEFAEHDYENASISRIVVQAGIAKGSLYQYFADKQDLYFYLVSLASQKKGEFMAGILGGQSDVPVFERLHILFSAMLEFQQQFPLFAKLGNRILNANSPFSKELLEKARIATQRQFSELFEAGQSTGEIRMEVDPTAAGFIMSAVILEAGNQLDMTLQDFEKVYTQLVLILKNGMSKSENENGVNNVNV